METNIEQKFIEAESQWEHEVEEYLEDESNGGLADEFDAEEYQRKIELDARKQADKLIKANKRELDRLKTHAGKCLEENNFEGYSYAIKKLRKFYRQPYNDDLIKSMWNSSRGALFDICKSISAELNANKK